MNAETITRTATIGRRFGAFIIDHFIISFLVMLPVAWFFDISHIDTFFAAFPIIIFAGVAGHVFKDIFGRSIGKCLFELTITDANDPQQNPGVWRRIKRNLLIVIWPVEFFVMLNDKRNQRLGDRIASTQVMASNLRKLR